MPETTTKVIHTPQNICRCGFAQRDITPPSGLYHRMWGAAEHDRATGVHRPILTTAMALEPIKRDDIQVWVALDHCLLWHAEFDEFQYEISRKAGVPVEQLTIVFSHTHAAGLIDKSRVELPGGELIEAYFQDMLSAVVDAIDEARKDVGQPLLFTPQEDADWRRTGLLGRSDRSICVWIQSRWGCR